MNRRTFLAAALAVVGLPKPVFAKQCYNDGTCEVGIQNIAMTPAQQCPQWCWAASIQAIFGLHGYFVDQLTIVQRLFGSLVCLPVTNQQMFAAIAGNWTDQQGQSFSARPDLLYDPTIGFARQDALIVMINELDAGNPLINGAMGHATVLTALRYVVTPNGPQVVSATIRDPWPLNPNRRILSPQEAMATSFIASVAVT